MQLSTNWTVYFPSFTICFARTTNHFQIPFQYKTFISTKLEKNFPLFSLIIPHYLCTTEFFSLLFGRDTNQVHTDQVYL